MTSCGALVVVLLVALPGCGLTEGGPTDAGVPDVGVDARVDAEPILEAGKDVVEEPVVCDPDALKCPGNRCDETGCTFYATCAELHKARPTLPSTLYKFKAASKPEYFAYCDMEKESGGWTLVGRSVALASSADFGWYKAGGDPSLNNAPYSFDMTNYPGSPTEALVGVYTTSKDWGTPVYKINLPAGFPTSFKTTATAQLTGTAVVPPGCGSALATNLEFAGFTSNADTFFFGATGTVGDAGDAGIITGGLGYAGFDLGLPDCGANGEMGAKQGQIFVR